MLWRNGEHYPDPTAGAAFQRIAREEATNEMNEGKRFERDFQASVPPDAWCYRLRDSPISYYGGNGAEGIRFAQDNICDFVLYRAPTLYLLELKTVGTPSASLTSLFGKYDPEKRCYKKQRHLQEMAKAEQAAAGLLALVVICYRRTGHTYAVPARNVLEWVERAHLAACAGNLVVMLLPARTDTRWFHDYIYQNKNAEIRFIKGRLKFGGGQRIPRRSPA